MRKRITEDDVSGGMEIERFEEPLTIRTAEGREETAPVGPQTTCALCTREVDDTLLCYECYEAGQRIDPATLPDTVEERS